jgi:hypothetical protein
MKFLLDNNLHIIFVTVFHRILDFKAGLDFYLGPFFFVFRLPGRLKSVFTALFYRRGCAHRLSIPSFFILLRSDRLQ